MATGGTTARERIPRRGRYLIPKTTPRRAEFVAVLCVCALAAHLVFAQLTIVVAVALFAITKVTRWRPLWLAIPAAAGVIWALAIGPASAVDGLLAGPRQVVGYLASVGGQPSRVLHLGAAFAGAGAWLPRQLPLALVTGAAEAALAMWLSWLHTDEWRVQAPRPGLVIAARRWYVARAVRAGSVVTRDGACLGIDGATGERAALTWRTAAAGVLCTGAAGSGTTTTSFQLVHAAIRRRKPVIAVDLSGSRQLAEWFAIVCGATSTPLQVFSAAGPACYEPLRSGDAARRTALVMGMIDWTGTADQYRRSCGAYLTDLFATATAAPGDPRTPVLAELLHLLNPAALRARCERVPPSHPHRQALIERVKVSTSLLQSDPQTTTALATQLAELRAAPIGRWLAPAPAEGASRIDLGQVLRYRGVALFCLDQGAHGRAAASVASLVAQDVMASCAELRKIGVAGDGLIWFDQCDGVRPALLGELISRSAGVGMPTVLTTTSPQAADSLAGQANTVVIHRMADPVMAERFARITGMKLAPGEQGRPPAAVRPGAPVMPGVAGVAGVAGPPVAAPVLGPAAGVAFVRRPVVAPEALCGLANGEFVMVVKGPSGRLVERGRTIPARLHTPSRRRAIAGTRPRQAAGSPLQPVAHQRQPFSTYRQQPGTPGSRNTVAGDPPGSLPSRLTGSTPGEVPESRLWPK
jgi:hypothetical protein